MSNEKELEWPIWSNKFKVCYGELEKPTRLKLMDDKDMILAMGFKIYGL